MQLSSPDHLSGRDRPAILRLSLVQLLWLAITLIAALLRFGRLGQIPLSPVEAAEAWRIWLFWSPAADGFFGSFSPAYFSLTALLTQILGFSDGVMRLVPAAAGLVSVILVYRFRPWLGELGALAAAFWLAVSPTLVTQSRLAGGDSLAVLAVLLLAGSAWPLVLTYRPPARWDYLAGAAAVALGITTSPIFYTGLLPLLGAAYWAGREQLRFRAAAAEHSQEDSSAPVPVRVTLIPDGPVRAAALRTAAITFLISGTLFFWHLPGFGQTADLLAGWFGSFSTGFSAPGWQQFLTLAGRYELLPLAAALIAAVWALFERQTVGQGLALWLGTAFLLAGLQNSSGAMLAMAVVPAALLLGYAAEQLRQAMAPQGAVYWVGSIQVAALLILLLLIVAANLGRYARLSFFDPADVAHLLLAILCALVALFIWLLVMIWDTPLGIGAGLITLILAGLVVQWGTAARVGVSSVVTGEAPVDALTTSREAPLLIEATTAAARELTGAVQAASLFSAIDHPLMRWYLREFDRAEFGDALPVQATHDLVISPADAEPAFGSDYLGTDFGFLACVCDSSASWLERMRRFFFITGAPTADQQRVVLWVRADLIVKNE